MTIAAPPSPALPLAGVRVLDLSRVLAGPWCTQTLADLGADVIKVERPASAASSGGDDTRGWGPPFLKDRNGDDTAEAAYYLGTNRNKRSITVDIAHAQGQALIRKIALQSDVFVENYKVGDMARYGLDFASLHALNPRLVYCSITGFGQTGPYRERAGYDYAIQGMGGLMSVTGPSRAEIADDASGGGPQKVGVAVADLFTGMYACTAILAALRHRDQSGQGQYIDLGLLDSQVAWLVNIGLNYLTSGEVPQRVGNAHPNIVPYDVMPAADGFVILAVGNDGQFAKFCQFAGAPELAADPRFVTNDARVRNRVELYGLLPALTRRKRQAEWVDGLARLGVPCSPVNNVDQVFADPQVQARGMQIALAHPLAGKGTVDLIGNPIKLSETPVTYRRPPPTLGQHTEEVLRELGLGEAEIAALKAEGAI